MATVQDQQFVHNYSKVLVQAWTDSAFNQRLHQDPVFVLNQNGFGLPDSANVTVEDGSGQPDLQAQISAWEEGHNTGNYVLYVPPQPQLGVESSKDPSGLAQDTYCCCCSPCCTCT
jgi:hypothetical protein